MNDVKRRGVPRSEGASRLDGARGFLARRLGGRGAGALLVAALLVALLIPGTALAAVAPPMTKGPRGNTQLLQGPFTSGPRVSGSPVVPLRPNDPALQRLKREADRRAQTAQPGGAFGPSPTQVPSGQLTPAVGTLNQPGFSFASGVDLSPPDPTGAIGTGNYVEMVNKHVGVYDRTTLALQSQVDLDTFMRRADTCDPQIQWDQQAQRWLYASIANCTAQTANNNYLMFGWSKTTSPTPLPNASNSGNWCSFQFFTGNDLDDYPKLGHNDKHIIIGTNVFVPTQSSSITSRIFAIEKPANGDTSCTPPNLFFTPASNSTPLTTADGSKAFTPVPANNADASPNGYVVAADDPRVVVNPSHIMAWHISGGGGVAPTLTGDGNISVTSFSVPANVPQPGSSNVISSSDTRLTQAVGDSDPDASGAKGIWTQHTVNNASGRSVVRWYELVPSLCSGGTCPAGAKRQEGTISSSSHFAFNGAISPTGSGRDAVIQYNLGSGTLLAQIHAQSRQSGLALGTTEGDTLLGTSSAADQDYTCTAPNGPPCRWGDYAGATPDPNVTDTVWGTNQGLGPANGNNGSWTTRNFALKIFAGYPRPKGATPVRVALVPAYKQCTSPNTTHPAPLSFGSCKPPVQVSDYLTVGTLDANGQAANFVGSVRMDSKASPADIAINVSLTDIRKKTDLSDYTGNVQTAMGMRVTDHLNGPSANESGTVSDFTFAFPVNCTATPDTTVGSTCQVTTTANTVLGAPMVVSGSRQTIGLGVVDVFDGGADGNIATADNTLFAWQGLFNP
jgi:hypothetical protein